MEVRQRSCADVLQVRQIVVHNDSGLVSFDWQTQGPAVQRARLCLWLAQSTANRRVHHKHNFCFATADFWRGSFTIKCWDRQCKAQFESYWKGHPWALPQALCGHRHLFSEPEPWPEAALEHMLVDAHAPPPALEASCCGQVHHAENADERMLAGVRVSQAPLAHEASHSKHRPSCGMHGNADRARSG